MRNSVERKIDIITKLADKLPYFSLDDLAPVEHDRHYLAVMLKRYEDADKVVRLKKGIYVSRKYTDRLEKKGEIGMYLHFIGNLIYAPSYLSLEYVLAENHLMTESVTAYTYMTTNKTASFSNDFGHFIYRSIKESLFSSYEAIDAGGLTVYKAGLPKALFDFLYLRKNSLPNQKSFNELRLNLDRLRKKDLDMVRRFIKTEGSKRMKEISIYLEEAWRESNPY